MVWMYKSLRISIVFDISVFEVSNFNCTYCYVAEYKKSTCKALSMMDLDKINYDLILELMEWIVDGEHQVRFITKILFRFD